MSRFGFSQRPPLRYYIITFIARCLGFRLMNTYRGTKEIGEDQGWATYGFTGELQVTFKLDPPDDDKVD